MKELSIYCDESGDFGEVTSLPAYYLVTFVIHENNDYIEECVKKLEESIKASGFLIEYIHSGPVIRREDVFEAYTLDERRKMLYKMLNFVVKAPVKCFTVKVDRKETYDKVSLSGKLAKCIKDILYEHMDFFHSFDKITVFYDNGQSELSLILNAVFSYEFSNIEFKKAEPQKYRLLQAADFVCTVELLKIKHEEKRLSNSEKKFFYKPQELKKTFIKSVEKKYL